MRRTLQTALLSLDFLIDSGVPVQAHAGWQENSAKPCDTGTNIPGLQKEFPTVDFRHVDPVYPDKTTEAGRKYAYNRRAIVERGQSVVRELRDREGTVVVVSHSGFMRTAVTGRWFFNADYRVFEFDHAHAHADGNVNGLKQWEITERGGMGRSRIERVVIGEEIPDEDEGLPENGEDGGVGAA
jgi:broad specificity phosphatase PhoE